LWRRGLSPFVLDSLPDLDLSESGSAVERQSLSEFRAPWGSFRAQRLQESLHLRKSSADLRGSGDQKTLFA
jgi:hypothetical protein